MLLILSRLLRFNLSCLTCLRQRWTGARWDWVMWTFASLLLGWVRSLQRCVSASFLLERCRSRVHGLVRRDSSSVRCLWIRHSHIATCFLLQDGGLRSGLQRRPVALAIIVQIQYLGDLVRVVVGVPRPPRSPWISPCIFAPRQKFLVPPLFCCWTDNWWHPVSAVGCLLRK